MTHRLVPRRGMKCGLWMTWAAILLLSHLVAANPPVQQNEEDGTCPIVSSERLRWTPWWPEPIAQPVIGVNNTEQRLDYADTVISVLEELGARIVNVTSTKDPAELRSLTGYWGLHINDLTRFATFTSSQQLNSIPGARDLFGDKDGLVRLERYARAQFGDSFIEWSPPSYILPSDMIEYLVEATRSPSELYVRKRLNTHSGSGVDVMSAQDITAYLDETLKKCGRSEENWPKCEEFPFVVQKYVVDPLLIVHYKFDVRWWCVVTSTQPLRAYMLPDGYAKIARSTPYDPADLSSKCGHVTNSMVQKHCSKQRRPTMALESSVRDIEFERRIFPIKTEHLFQAAKEILTQVLLASGWRLATKHLLTGTTAKTFQMLAIDVIYERESTRAVLLEINTNGYLRSGMMKIPSGKERLKELFRLTGFVGYDQEVMADVARTISDPDEVRRELENRYRGNWMPLF